MDSKTLWVTALVASFLAVARSGLHAQSAAHVHGEATLDLGIEGKSGTFVLRVPGDDLYGFEHEPRTSAEKSKRDGAISLLKSRASTMVQFDATLGCQIIPGAVAYSAGKHVEVTARFEFACKANPSGRDIRFGLTKLFPTIRTLKVQAVSENSQSGATIVADKGVVRP